jgi:hypothetical protein
MPRPTPVRRLATFANLAVAVLAVAVFATACRTEQPSDAEPFDLAAMIVDSGTHRILAVPYATVAAAARERFVRIYPGGYFALRADIVETPGKNRLDITFHEFIDYAHVMETEIQITGLDDGHTRIEATVYRFYRNWHFRRRKEDFESAFLAVFAERLRTGTWPPMPWMKTAAAESSDAPVPPKPE